MDYKDYQAAKSDFWFRAKKDLLFVLMSEIKNAGEHKQFKILNVGAGTGDDLEVLNRFGNVCVTDVDPVVLSLVPKAMCVETKVADICSLPYGEDEFDVVVSLDVFEHITDDVKAVSEVYRVLKPGGFLVFGVPAFQFLWSARDVALEHKRRYDKRMLKHLFFAFSLRYINHWNFVLFVPVALQRLLMRYAKPTIESVQLPKWLNTFLYHLMKLDTFYVKHQISLPFGISLVGWCRK